MGTLRATPQGAEAPLKDPSNMPKRLLDKSKHALRGRMETQTGIPVKAEVCSLPGGRRFCILFSCWDIRGGWEKYQEQEGNYAQSTVARTHLVHRPGVL